MKATCCRISQASGCTRTVLACVSFQTGAQAAAAFYQELHRIELYQTPLQSSWHIIGPYQTALIVRARPFPWYQVLLPPEPLGMLTQWPNLLRQFRKLHAVLDAVQQVHEAQGEAVVPSLQALQLQIAIARDAVLQGCLPQVCACINCIVLPHLIRQHGT